MKKILIACGALKAVVLPDFGGMVAELSIGEANVLRMDYGLLGLGNVLAGGIPVLFPFASRCENDEAEFLGKRYTMPMHGFAKDQPFEVTRTWPQGCELRLEDNAATRRLYPFAFALTLAYELRETALHTTMRVENRGEVPLPFAAGFHPYFLTPCREQARCEMQMRAYWDYAHPEADGAPAQRELQGELRLSDEYDAVFFGGRPGAQITCPPMGYRARLVCGDDFPVMTVCTTQKGASCLEPWQARPGAVRRPEECRMLAGGETGQYAYVIELERA